MNETERILNEVESRLKACIKQLDSIDDDYNRTYLFGQRQALIGMKEYIEAMLNLI